MIADPDHPAWSRRHPVLSVVVFVGLAMLGVIVAARLVGDLDVDDKPTLATSPQPRTTAPRPSPSPTFDGHDESKLSCQHYRNVMGDLSDGVLTDEEARTKLKEVEGDAIIATAEVRQAARAMLATWTTGTTEEFIAAAGEMDEACDEAGW